MDHSGESPLAQQGAVSEADSLYSSQNREFLAPGTVGENSSMVAGDKSPCHVTSEHGKLHLVNPAGQTTGHGSLQYHGNDYTILDESIPEQAFYLTQRDPLLESFPEAFQLVFASRFRDFAFLMFDSAGLSQVAFHSVCPVQPCKQHAWVPSHPMSTGMPPAAARSQVGAPSMVRSSPMDLSVGGPSSQTPWSSGMDGRPMSSRLGLHHPPPPLWFPFNHKGTRVTR